MMGGEVGTGVDGGTVAEIVIMVLVGVAVGVRGGNEVETGKAGSVATGAV
jgi:hypothetical protein